MRICPRKKRPYTYAGEEYYADTRSYSGNGGNGGNGGDIILGVTYTLASINTLEPIYDCGKYGIAGTCGPVLDYGEDVHGWWGSNGIDGTSGTTDNSYYTEFEEWVKNILDVKI